MKEKISEQKMERKAQGRQLLKVLFCFVSIFSVKYKARSSVKSRNGKGIGLAT
jgi:hypothetical protein